MFCGGGTRRRTWGVNPHLEATFTIRVTYLYQNIIVRHELHRDSAHRRQP